MIMILSGADRRRGEHSLLQLHLCLRRALPRRLSLLPSQGAPCSCLLASTAHLLFSRQVFFHSNGHGMNPNLQLDGNVCLSLLGTWSGESSERWLAKKSSLLQIIVSLQGLVLGAKVRALYSLASPPALPLVSSSWLRHYHLVI